MLTTAQVDHFRVFGRDAVFEDATRGGGPNAGCIDVVLQRDGNAVQRTANMSSSALAIQTIGLRQCVRIDREYGM